VSLPVSISNGQPAAGARNLETTASEDDYVFSTSQAGSLILDFSACSAVNAGPKFDLVDDTTGASVSTGNAWQCGHFELDNIPAGQYRLEITDDGQPGTYDLALYQPEGPTLSEGAAQTGFDHAVEGATGLASYFPGGGSLPATPPSGND
jgi:hypothetical protein